MCMKLRVFGQARDIGSVFLWSAVLGLLGTAATEAAFKADLQGQHAGGTNWVNGPLQGWKELQFIPARALFTGGPATNQVITVRFDHTRSSGTTRGIENVTGFTPSSNVLITAGPTLSAPAGDDIWSYTFTITITNAADGFVEFRARLAAGAHLFPGSSLNLSLPGPG
jgi:hypothetical protein